MSKCGALIVQPALARCQCRRYGRTPAHFRRAQHPTGPFHFIALFCLRC